MKLNEIIQRELKTIQAVNFIGSESESQTCSIGEFDFHRIGIQFERQKTLFHPIRGIQLSDMTYVMRELQRRCKVNPIAGDERVLLYGEMLNKRPQVIFVQESQLYTEEVILIPEAARKISSPGAPTYWDDYRIDYIPVFKAR